MENLTKNTRFFVEGTGRAIINDGHGNIGYVHLQDAVFDFASKMEDIYGGESNTSLYQYQTEKSGKINFTNASMDAQTVALTQGVEMSKKPVVFAMDEEVEIQADGSFTLAHATEADLSTLMLVDDERKAVPVTAGKVDTSHANKKLKATYCYTATSKAVGVDVDTVSVPGYVQILFRSKPMKQKDGRVIQQLITIYKARSSGALKLDYKHKNAFAPELEFNIADPEREDGKFWSYAVVDVTE
jgi:hypothetical protein